MWSLFDPDRCPSCPTCGAQRSTRPTAAEADGRFVRQVKARDLYGRMMRTLAQTGNGWMTFKDAANRACNQTAEPGNVVHLSNLCTEIIEVSTDAETAVCNLGSINLARTSHDGRSQPDSTGRRWRRRCDRGAVPRPRHRHQLLPEHPGGGEQPALAPGRPRRDGPAGRLLPAAPAVRLARGARAVDAARRGDLPDRAGDLGRAGGMARGAPGLRADPGGPRATCSPTCGALRPTQTDRWDGAARADRRAPGCATRCSSRSRRRRPSPRSPAATSASSRRSRTCSSARRCPASSCRSTPHWSASSRRTVCGRPTCVTRSSGPTARCRASRPCRLRSRTVPHRLGAAAEGADRPGRRPRALHRPEPVAEPVPGRADHRQALLDVPLRLEEAA